MDHVQMVNNRNMLIASLNIGIGTTIGAGHWW